MADIFISYAREDAARAAGLAETFESLGWSAWHDDDIRAGAPYDAVIDQQLDAASCVVVIWSRASIDSNWVRAEASTADDQGKLVPVTFESGLRLPVRFRQFNVTHLTSTAIYPPTGEALQLVADIARLTGKPPAGVDPRVYVAADRGRSAGAHLVTVGHWLITVRFLGIGAYYDLRLHPNGTVTGNAGWAVSRADLGGRWFYDPAEEVLQLELSGGLIEGTKAIPVQITNWLTSDSAECMFEHRKARIERVVP